MMPHPTSPLMYGAHGHIAAPLKLEDRGQFQPCEVLQHDQDGLFIHPVFDVGVAFWSYCQIWCLVIVMRRPDLGLTA